MNFQFRVKAPPVKMTIDATKIKCQLIKSNAITADKNMEQSANIDIAIMAGAQFTVSNTITINGKTETPISIEYTVKTAWRPDNYILMTIPKANLLYQTGSSNTPTSLITSSNYKTASISIGGQTYSVDSAKSFYTAGTNWNADTILWGLSNVSNSIAKNQLLRITLNVTLQPVIYTLLDGFTLKIQGTLGQTPTQLTDTNLKDVEQSFDPNNAISGLPVKGGIITGSYPTTTTGTASILGTGNGVGATNAEYQMDFTPSLPIPSEGVMTITVPSGVTVPGSLTVKCISGCLSAGVLSWDSVKSQIKIRSAFNNGYIVGGTKVSFTVTGFTNPNDSAERSLSILTQYEYNSSLINIENITGFKITAQEGICQVQEVFVTDGDVRIYAQPASYTFKLWCTHTLETTYGIKISFPEDFILINGANCIVTGYNTRYYCLTDGTKREIYIREFLSSSIAAKQLITFTVNSIINPGSQTYTGSGKIYTTDSTGRELDTGSWSMPQKYYKNGNITTFQVIPATQSVGEFPVKYRFIVTPNGEVERYSYLKIDLPADLKIPTTSSRINLFETKCGSNVSGFTNTVISCVVKDSGSSIQVKDGFLYAGSTNFTDSDGLYFPPQLSFELDGFQNPRSGGEFGPFNVSIYTKKDKLLYQWQTTDAPKVRMSGITQPAYIDASYENKKNGALTWLEFLVTTTNGMSENDKIVVKLPSGWQFTPDTKVEGRSNNLANTLQSTISIDSRTIEITVAVSLALKRRLSDQFEKGERNLYAVEAGLSIQFRLTNVRNRDSLRPSDTSIEYYVYSSAGVLFEEKTSGMMMQNTELGELSVNVNGLVPSDFRADYSTNYTLSIKAENYEKNMAFTVRLPPEINFSSSLPACSGLTGNTGSLICKADVSKKTLHFSNVFTYFETNPGELKILISTLHNPTKNLITQSFYIVTQTFDGYLMDRITDGLFINFYCEYPCQQCPQGQPSFCESCYETAVERYFHENKCLSICPDKLVGTKNMTCTSCASPCVTCKGTATYCTSCIEGYYEIEGGKCREEVTWYFPFVGTAFVFFILITISEIATKRVSNFKESLIAFWSIPEVLSWACLILFMWNRVSHESYSTGLAMLGAIFYVCLNSVHAIIHPRYMVPNSLFSYKQLLTKYKCGTFFARSISYIFSFKFSLILVSHFFNSPRLKGDYSAMNWKQFNRFSLVFILLPYSCMMAACILFILTDGFWSYPGFVAAEVIVLSTFVAILLAIDAISAIKCKTVGKKKTNKAIKVATGADYESDEDEIDMRKRVQNQAQVTRIRERDDFGDSYDEECDSVDDLKRVRPRSIRRAESEASYNSRLSHQTAIMNEEARKQIAMLEELAHQMREEKRQLQLDKERIEREKRQLEDQRNHTAHSMEPYMDGYEMQPLSEQELLEQQLKEAETKKQILAAQALRRNFRDFEGEMEDYEPVEEENSEDAKSSATETMDCVQLPILPAYGNVDNFDRNNQGDNQFWMQQITPRAGAQSRLSLNDLSGDSLMKMERRPNAIYDVTSNVPASAYEGVIRPGVVDAVYHDSKSYKQLSKSEHFYQRSEAEMEKNSEILQRSMEREDHFVPEGAILSYYGDKNEKRGEAEFFQNIEERLFENIKSTISDQQDEKYFVNIQAVAGKADKAGELVGPTEHFFKPEPPTFESVAEDEPIERNATAQHFFNPEKAHIGEADDAQRSGIATPVQYLEKAKHAYGDDLEYPKIKKSGSEHLFNNESAVKDNVSNMRSMSGSDLIYHEMEPAHHGRNSENFSKDATEQNFINRDEAMYSQAHDQMSHQSSKQFFKQEEAIRGDVSSQDQSIAATQQNYFQNVDHAELGRSDSYDRLRKEDNQEYMNKSDLGGAGYASPVEDLHGNVDYLNKSEAEYGRQSTVNRNAEDEHEVEDEPSEDSSGRSQSSEGGIANHSPFAAGADINNQNRFKEADPEAAVISSPNKRVTGKAPAQQLKSQQPKKQAKTILYSDKSETSVEDLMDETPSNYNIQNGRFEGKSLGLKALLLHAKGYQAQTIDPNNNAHSMPELDRFGLSAGDLQNKSPQQARPGDGLLAPGYLGAQKGIIGSQKDERQFINNLYQTGQSRASIEGHSHAHGPAHSRKSVGGISSNHQWRGSVPLHGQRVQIVGEESSNNGEASFSQTRNTRNNVRTNKQFVEDPRTGGRQQLPQPFAAGAFSPAPNQNQQNDRLRKVTKNNYFGGAT